MDTSALLSVAAAAEQLGIVLPDVHKRSMFRAADGQWHDAASRAAACPDVTEELCRVSYGELSRLPWCEECFSIPWAVTDVLEVLEHVVDLCRSAERLVQQPSPRHGAHLLRLHHTVEALCSGEPHWSDAIEDALEVSRDVLTSFCREHGEILVEGTLVALSGVDVCNQQTDDSVIELLLLRHHDPLSMHGRVIVRVHHHEMATLFRWAQRRAVTFWDTFETTGGRDLQLEELWRDGIGEDPAQALQVLKALTV